MRNKKPDPPVKDRHCSVCEVPLTPENWYGGRKNYLCIKHQNERAVQSRRQGAAQEGHRRRQRDWNQRHADRVQQNVAESRRRRRLGIVSARNVGRPRIHPPPPAPTWPPGEGWARSDRSKVDHYLEASGSSLCNAWYWPSEKRHATTTRPCKGCARALERRLDRQAATRQRVETVDA